jgi:hypothetical protein
MAATVLFETNAKPGDRSFIFQYAIEMIYRKGDSVTVQNGKGLSYVTTVVSADEKNITVADPIPATWDDSQIAVAGSASVMGGTPPISGTGGGGGPSGVLGSLTNVVITSPQNGQALEYRGGLWKNVDINLNDIKDVTAAAPVTDKSVLTWSTVRSRWEPVLPATPTVTLKDLTDTQIKPVVQDGDLLTWDASTSRWIAQPPQAGSGTMGGLADTNITSPRSDQILVWNNTTAKWTPTNRIRTLVALDDVAIGGAILDGQVLTWEGATNRWKAKPTVAGVTTLQALTDTTIPVGGPATDGVALLWDNTAKKWAPKALTESLDDLTDVQAATPTDGQVLSYSLAAGKWGPTTVSAAGTIGMNGLSDVDTATTPPNQGQGLIWDSINKIWKPGSPLTTTPDLQDLGNVLATMTPTADQVLAWDDGLKKWKAVDHAARNLADLLDVTYPTTPTDGQVLVYKAAGGTGGAAHWEPGAAGAGAIGDLTDVDPDHTFTTIEGMVLHWNAADNVWESRLPAGGGTTLGAADVDMGGFHITGLSNPHTGTIGAQDAVPRDWVQQQIAAGNLYQGIYKPRVNAPDLLAETDAKAWANPYPIPAAGSVVGAPNVGLPNPAGTDIQVWFDFGGQGFNTFPATATQPIQVTVYFSDMTKVQFNLAPATYNTVGELEAEFKNHIIGTPITNIRADNTGASPWIAIETTAPLYVLGMTPVAGGGHPAATPGANNKVLNSYSWVISTADPNVPEPAPIGIPGIAAGTLLANSDTIQWSTAAQGFQILAGGNLTQAFADTRYWNVAKGNMAWRDQPYASGSVVLAHDAWWRATQNITAGNGEPGSVQAGVSWKKINATYGATTFFGSGDFDQSDTSAANNWGMPAGTYPSGQQPVNGDVYYDITTGAIAEFRVTENAATFILTGEVKAGATVIGVANIGAPAGGGPDILNWTIDGGAGGWAQNAHYTMVVPPVNPSFNLAATKKGDIATDGDLKTPTGTFVAGDWYAVTAAVTGNTAGDPWNGVAAANGAALIYTGFDTLNAPSVEGWPIHDGWVLAPNPPAGGAAFNFTLRVQPTLGAFAGQAITPGNKLVVWTGDPDADNRGWVIIADTAPKQWSVNTPHPQKSPDTVRATVKRGYEVRFELTMDAAIAEDDEVVLLENFPDHNSTYTIEIIDKDDAGALYEFMIAIDRKSPAGLSQIITMSYGSQFKEIKAGYTGGTHDWAIVAKTTADAHGRSYRLIVKSDNSPLDLIIVGDGVRKVTWDRWSSYGNSFNATKDYPGHELQDFLDAKSGDSQAAQLDTAQPAGANMQGRQVALTGNKLYKVSGVWKNETNAREAFITIRNAANERMTEANCHVVGFDRYQMGGTGYNQTGTLDLTPGPTPGFWRSSYGAPAQNTWHPFWLTLDLRDPDIQQMRYVCRFKGKDSKLYYYEAWAVWEVSTFKAANYYFSRYDADTIHWKVYND